MRVVRRGQAEMKPKFGLGGQGLRESEISGGSPKKGKARRPSFSFWGTGRGFGGGTWY